MMYSWEESDIRGGVLLEAVDTTALDRFYIITERKSDKNKGNRIYGVVSLHNGVEIYKGDRAEVAFWLFDNHAPVTTVVNTSNLLHKESVKKYAE